MRSEITGTPACSYARITYCRDSDPAGEAPRPPADSGRMDSLNERLTRPDTIHTSSGQAVQVRTPGGSPGGFPGDWRKVLTWSALSLGLSALCIAAVLRFLGAGDSVRSLLRVGAGTVGVCILIVVAGWVVDSWRLMVLARAMGGRLSLWESIKISVMGSFMAGVTPLDTGGEPLKIFFLRKWARMGTGQATAAVALAAILHATTKFILWALAPLVAVMLHVSLRVHSVASGVVAVGLFFYFATVLVLGASVIWPSSVSGVFTRFMSLPLVKRFAGPEMRKKAEEKVLHAAQDFREGIIALRSSGALALAAFALSVLHWAVLLTVPAFLLWRLGSSLPWFEVFVLSLGVYLIAAYTPTPGGSGGAEVGTALFFASLLPTGVLGTFMLVWRALTFYFPVAVGALVLGLEAGVGAVNRRVK